VRIGIALRLQGNQTAALDAFRRALALRPPEAGQAGDEPAASVERAVNVNRVGTIRYSQEDYPAALEAYQEGLALARRLAERFPKDHAVRNRLAVGHEKVADILYWQDDLAGSAAHYGQAIALYRDLARDDPNQAEWQENLGRTLLSLGQVYQWQADVPRARQYIEEALAIAQRFHQLDPENETRRSAALSCRLTLANLKKQENLEKATRELLAGQRELHEVRQQQVKKDPRNAFWQLFLANAKKGIAHSLAVLAQKKALARPQDLDEALPLLQGARAILEGLVKQDPTNGQFLAGLAGTFTSLDSLYRVQGKQAEALDVAVQGPGWRWSLPGTRPAASRRTRSGRSGWRAVTPAWEACCRCTAFPGPGRRSTRPRRATSSWPPSGRTTWPTSAAWPVPSRPLPAPCRSRKP
jgi:tetratricopeptide (TPR) repeat protein